MSGGERVTVRVARLAEALDLPTPSRATPGAAGFDLRARLDAPLELAPGERRLVPTGVRLAIPPGFEGQVRPRSGLALREGLGLVNAPGTIDSDYRGEVGVIVINHGRNPVRLERGERIAQLVIQRLPDVEWVDVDELPTSERGTGGFGHSGRG